MPSGMKTVERIKVGERDRADLGDVQQLADSIAAVGLLHPVVITEFGELVAGERRLAAVRLLGWTTVPVTVVDLSSAGEVLQAEADENTCRKPLTPYEAARARERRARLLAPKAKEAQGRPGQDRSSKLDERPGPVRKVASIGTGYSGSTLDKVDKIRDAAERGVVRQGKAEVPVPEPVREVAREALEEVKQTGAAVDRADRKVAQAVADYIEESADVKAAKLRAAVWKALRAADELPKLSAEHVAAIADEELMDAIAHTASCISMWHGYIIQQRPRGLRIVEGE